MSENNPILNNLKKSVETGNSKLMAKSIGEALSAGLPTEVIVSDGLGKGMESIGDMFDKAEIFLPQVVAAAKVMEAALDMLHADDEVMNNLYRGTVVMGSVLGDIHEIGKDVCIAMLRGAGYKVVDLGPDVSPERFAEAARIHSADIVGGSALMTTTLPMQKRIVKEFGDEGVSSYVVFGGAPCSDKWVREIGGDGYSANASEMVLLVNGLLNSQSL